MTPLSVATECCLLLVGLHQKGISVSASKVGGFFFPEKTKEVNSMGMSSRHQSKGAAAGENDQEDTPKYLEETSSQIWSGWNCNVSHKAQLATYRLLVCDHWS